MQRQQRSPPQAIPTVPALTFAAWSCTAAHTWSTYRFYPSYCLSCNPQVYRNHRLAFHSSPRQKPILCRWDTNAWFSSSTAACACFGVSINKWQPILKPEAQHKHTSPSHIWCGSNVALKPPDGCRAVCLSAFPRKLFPGLFASTCGFTILGSSCTFAFFTTALSLFGLSSCAGLSDCFVFVDTGVNSP